MPNEREFQERSLGSKGFLRITGDTSEHAGNFFALHAINGDAVIAAATESNGSSLDGMTIDQGDTIYGRFTSVTLTSGNLIAYKI